MRRLPPLVLAAMLAAGCGGESPRSKRASRTSDFARALVLKPISRVGHWQKVLLSPDGKTWLAQWSGECEVQETFFVSVSGGTARPVAGRRGVESYALGWSRGGRARVLLPRGVCGGSFGVAGVYLVDPEGGRPTLVKRVKSRPGGA